MTQGSTAVHPKGTPRHNLLYTVNIFIFSDLYVSEQYSVPVNLNYVADSGEPANIGSFYTFKERLGNFSGILIIIILPNLRLA